MGLEYKITGVIQLTAVLIIVAYIYLLNDVLPRPFALVAVLFFVAKGIAFTFMKQNALSLSDTIAGIYLLFSVLGWFSIGLLNWAAILFLIQKGIVYLFR